MISSGTFKVTFCKTDTPEVHERYRFPWFLAHVFVMTRNTFLQNFHGGLVDMPFPATERRTMAVPIYAQMRTRLDTVQQLWICFVFKRGLSFSASAGFHHEFTKGKLMSSAFHWFQTLDNSNLCCWSILLLKMRGFWRSDGKEISQNFALYKILHGLIDFPKFSRIVIRNLYCKILCFYFFLFFSHRLSKMS